jgi:Putative bacterial sensory transduction regulator
MKFLSASLLASALLFSAAPAMAANHSTGDTSSEEAPDAIGSNTTTSPGPGGSETDKAAPPSNGDLVTAENPDSVLSALKDLGYPGKLEKLKSGRTSITVTVSGLTTYIDFYDCSDDMTDCYTLLFNVTLDLKDGTNLDKANEWNSKQITGRVWLDDSKDPTLDVALSTFDGISADTFDQNVKLWDKKIGDFKDFFDF